MLVSVFNSYYEPIPVKDVEIEEWLFDNSFKGAVEKIRACVNPDKRKALKMQLPAITVAGTFHERHREAQKSESFLLCLDIDGGQNLFVNDWERAKIAISGIEGHLYSGLSVGGNGIYSIFRIQDPKCHRFYYASLAKDILALGYKVDLHCSNICSLRGVSYDPNPVHTPNPVAYENMIEPNNAPFTKSMGDTHKQVEKVVSEIERRNINIAESYYNWFRVCCALVNQFGEEGRDFFHRISRQSAKYTRFENDIQFDKCLNDKKKPLNPISIRTLFRMCRDAGVGSSAASSKYDKFRFRGYLNQ